MVSVNPAKPTPLEDKFILTSEEAAEFLGVSLRTIRYWVATRRIPYFHLGRFIRFKPADLTGFLESGRVEPLEHQRTMSSASTAHGGAAWRAEWLSRTVSRFMARRTFGTIRRLPSGRWHARFRDRDGQQKARRRHLQRKQTPADGSPNPGRH